jgi:hypothetical protein
MARQHHDTNGVEEISPGLPDSERATPGIQFPPHHFRAKRGEQSEHFSPPDQSNDTSSSSSQRKFYLLLKFLSAASSI